MNNLFSFENVKLIDIKNKERANLYAKIDSISVQKTINGTDFLNVTLIDDTTMLNAKKWNIDDNDRTYKIGQIVYISGVGSEYNGKVQLIIDKIRLINDSDDVDVSIFYPKAPISIEELKIKLNKYLNLIENPKINQITTALFKKYEDRYLLFPAASKNHHAFISGLSYHVCTMLDIASGLVKIYQNVNKDLLYAGIILHDIGKVIELSDHFSPEYTLVGKLIGHINIAFEEIRLTANELQIDGEEVILLQHLILSHHGLLEYGSPKTPMILEAELLHLIDLMDSRVNIISDELKQANDNEFTKRIYSLDSKAYYKHHIK